MKDTFYFSHDYNARSDDKIQELMMMHGVTGYGIWWCIVEDLYNNNNALSLKTDALAYRYRCDKDTVHSIIHDFSLFVIADPFFYSESVAERLAKRDAKSLKAKTSAMNRWQKKSQSDGNANVLQSQSDGNAIKESKVKDNKGKKSKVKKTKEERDAAAFAALPTASIEAFEKFGTWADKNAPEVLKMREPLTAAQLFKLKEKFTTEQIADLFAKMHNRADLRKKNISAYLTFINWSKREFNGMPGAAAGRGSTYTKDKMKQLEQQQHEQQQST